MIAGRRYWLLIWYGILLIGLVGAVASIYWGRRTRWRNGDEVLRALGTMAVSGGMLLLLQGLGDWLGELLLGLAAGCFLGAFVLGRRRRAGQDPPTA